MDCLSYSSIPRERAACVFSRDGALKRVETGTLSSLCDIGARIEFAPRSCEEESEELYALRLSDDRALYVRARDEPSVSTGTRVSAPFFFVFN